MTIIDLRLVILIAVPIILLIGVIYIIINSPIFEDGTALPKIIIERVEFKADDIIIVNVRNIGQDVVTIAQADIDDSPVNAIARPTNILERFSSTQILIPYRWIEGRPYEIGVTTADGTRFFYNVEAAIATPAPDTEQMLYFVLLGTYVGIIPIMLGLLWFPVVKRVREHWYELFLSITIGLLVSLLIDTIVHAFEIVDTFEVVNGNILIPTIMISFFLILLLTVNKSIITHGNKVLHLSYLIAFGIGLHNLGEGLAIGAALTAGAVVLSKFLVIGFTIHNITEGFAIVSPMVRSRVKMAHFIFLGIVAGVPVIIGSWIGVFLNIPLVSATFLAIGAAAILEVIYIIFEWMRSKNIIILSKHNMVGLVTGMSIMYITGSLL
jgi:ZIP family zinc transporter